MFPTPVGPQSFHKNLWSNKKGARMGDVLLTFIKKYDII